MGDFINFLFDRYDRPSSSCHCHGAAAIAPERSGASLIGPRLMGDFINVLFDRYDRPS